MFIGAFLKQVRIKKNITLQTVSKELNIAIYNLEAIEEDKYTKTPGGVYTIGFIRVYSNYLNLDSNEIINEYKTQISLSEIPEPIELPKPVEASYSPIKIISFFAVVSISLVFYFLLINKFNLQPEYAITPDVPEGFESIIEEYEVEIALSKLNKSNKEEIESQINYERDYNFDYFSFKTLEKSYIWQMEKYSAMKVWHLADKSRRGTHLIVYY